VANISTPNYRQKDLSVDKFQAMLQARAAEKEDAPPGSVGFSDIGASVEEPTDSILLDSRRDTDLAGHGYAFEPSGDVDTIAEDVVVLNNGRMELAAPV